MADLALTIKWEPALIAAIIDAVDKGFGRSALPMEARKIVVESVSSAVLDALQKRALPATKGPTDG